MLCNWMAPLKTVLTQSSPCSPALCPTIGAIPLYVGQHRLLPGEGVSPLYKWYERSSVLKWLLFSASSKALEPGVLQSMRSQRVRYDLASHHHHHQHHHQVGISTKVRPVTQVGSWRSLAAVLGKRVSVLPHHDYALELLGKVFFLGKKKKKSNTYTTLQTNWIIHGLLVWHLGIIYF